MSEIAQMTMPPTGLDKCGLPQPCEGSYKPSQGLPQAGARDPRAILDQYGKPYTKPETREVAPATLGGWRYYMANTVADLLTPARLVILLREAEQGNILHQMELFEAMEERDARLSGLFTQRKSGVTSCEFTLDPGDDSSAALRARDFCAALLPAPEGNRLGRIQSWAERLRDLLDAVAKGFACLEILWETSERQWLPSDLKFRPQRWWTLDLVDRQKLLLRDVSAPIGVPVNPFNFIMHRHNAHSGSLQRGGISLACARPFLVRNYAMRDWLQLAELCGVPVRLGELPPGATQEDADLMWRALTSLGSAAAGMVPAGGKITFADNVRQANNGELFDKLRERAGEEMALAVLGQTFTGGGGEGHALGFSGRAHENVRFDLVDSDARALDETLNRQFFGPITLLNFGPDVPAPIYRTLVEEPVDLQRLATSVSTLVSVGLRVPAKWARKKFGIPAPADDEEVLAAATAGRNGKNGNYELLEDNHE
jgi:phage gp29-like protein